MKVSYYRDKPAWKKVGTIIGFTDDNDNTLFKFKQKIKRSNRKWWNERWPNNVIIKISE